MTQDEINQVKAVVAKWYWQPDTWRRRGLTRYYESAPIRSDLLHNLVEYLKTEETTSLMVLNKKMELGETWKATDAWYQTAPNDKWQGTDSAKIRVYQTLSPAADAAQGPVVLENGCQYTVDHTFYWDVETLPAVPEGESGIQYVMTGVQRDPQTKLYSCVIERRERVAQTIALHDSAATVFERVGEAQYLGVKADDVASTGLPASAGDGRLVKRELTKNPDCTTNIVNTVTDEQPVEGAAVEFRRTLRGLATSTTDRNQTDPITPETMSPGEVRRTEKTVGGLNNNVVMESQPIALADIRRSCERVALEHTDTRTDAATEAPPFEDDDSSSSSSSDFAPVNRRVRMTSVRNDENGYDNETQVTEWRARRKEKTWEDEHYSYAYCSYVNEPEPLIPGSGEIISCSFTPNDHGSYNGSYTIRTLISGSGSESSSWSKSGCTKDITETYVKPGGKQFKRVWTVTFDAWFGPKKWVLDNVYQVRTGGATAKDYPFIGCHSGIKSGGNDGFLGIRYTAAVPGGESPVNP